MKVFSAIATHVMGMLINWVQSIPPLCSLTEGWWQMAKGETLTFSPSLTDKFR